MPLLEGVCLGPYEVHGLIGAGGMGEVYRARDTRLGREVAIKVMAARLAHDTQGLRRFEQEARTASALNHPNVLGIHDIGSHEGSTYVVTELLEGDTLRTHLRQGISVQKAIEIAVQVAQGLAAAHEKGIVHRDLKPSNIFVTRDGRAKILDFGLAKLVDTAEEHTSAEPTRTLTSPGAMVGTAGYAAPEQVVGRPSGPRSDIFALGVVLYEMLARVPPFSGENRVDVLAAILHEDPPPMSARSRHIPPVLESLVRRCLEKRAEERFQTARDLAFALESALGLVQSDDGLRAYVPPGPERRRRRALRHIAYGGAILAAVLLGLGLKSLIPAPGRRLAEPRDLTPHQLTTDPGVESEPALSPDGSFVAFTGQKNGGTDIWLTDVRGGPALRLTRHPAADRAPAWFPDGGSLVFVSEREGRRGIWKVHRLGGPPERVLAEGSDPAVSPDGSRVAFARPGSSGVPRIAIAALGAPDAVELTSPAPGDLWGHWHPAWSPDGSLICYSDLFDLHLLDVDTGVSRPLTRGREGDTHPVFAGDGRHVYFSSRRGRTLALWRIGVDGRGIQRMTFGSGPENRPSLAADGSLLAYSTHSADPDLVLVDRQTGRRKRISEPGVESSPVFLPGDSGLVFESDRDRSWGLWTQALEKGRPVDALRPLTHERGSESVPAASPDGRWVAYGRTLEGQRDIWVVPSRGGTARPIVESPAQDLHPAWSPDGSQLAFVSNRAGSPNIWLAASRDGAVVGEAKAVTGGEATDYFPTWSPDGRQIAFVRSESASAEAWVVAADRSSPPRRLTTEGQVECVRWERDGQGLLASGQWGEDSTTIRTVPLDGGPARPLEPPVELGRADYVDLFDISWDGQTLVFIEHPSRGDVWLLEARDGTF